MLRRVWAHRFGDNRVGCGRVRVVGLIHHLDEAPPFDVRHRRNGGRSDRRPGVVGGRVVHGG